MLTAMTAQPIDARELEALFRRFEGRVSIGLAVSGGVDSTALMHLAVRWRRHAGEGAPALTVLTVDHGLRPESARECEAVVRAAAALGLPAHVLRWQGAKPATGVQAAARAARYDLLAGYAHAHGLCAIATAHHLDDQAETLLMRLARGSGVDGLAAMPAESAWAGVTLLRPLLDMPQARLGATLTQAGVSWLEDPSNASARYERNRLRRVWDSLEELGFTAQALALTAARMRRAREALEAGADRFLAEHVHLAAAGYARLPASALRTAPEEIALRALGRLLAAVGGQDAAPRLARLESLTAALRAGGRQTRTLAGCRLVSDGTSMTVLREPGRRGLPELSLEPGAVGVWDRRFRVTASAGLDGPVTVRALGQAGLREVRERAAEGLLPPYGTAADLVSFWRGGEVLAVPHLRYAGPGTAAEGRSEAPFCGAVFINSAFVGQGPDTPAIPR